MAELFKYLCEKSERTQSLLESGVLPLRGGARFRITFAATKLLNKESDNFRFQGRTRPTEGPRLIPQVVPCRREQYTLC